MRNIVLALAVLFMFSGFVSADACDFTFSHCEAQPNAVVEGGNTRLYARVTPNVQTMTFRLTGPTGTHDFTGNSAGSGGGYYKYEYNLDPQAEGMLGVYSLQCRASWPGCPTDTESGGSLLVSAVDTYDCSSDYAYTITLNMSASVGNNFDYHYVNLTNLSKYVYSDLSNIEVSRGGGLSINGVNRTGDYQLLVNATNCSGANVTYNCNDLFVRILPWNDPGIILNIYGVVGHQSNQKNWTLSKDNFTVNSNVYYLDLYKEGNGLNWSYAGITNQTMLVKCLTYAPFSVDMFTGFKDNYLLATRAPPAMRMDVYNGSSVFTREVQEFAGDKDVNYFLVHPTSNINVHAFNIQDYTEYYINGVLSFERHILNGGSVVYSKIISVSQWIYNVQLLDGYTYNLYVYNSEGGKSVSLGSLTSEGNTTEVIGITTPPSPSKPYAYLDLTMYLNKDPATNRVSFTYSGVGVLDANFTVYNISGDGNIVHTSNLSVDSGVFSFTLPNITFTYKIQGKVLDGNGLHIISEGVYFDESYINASAFNKNALPATFAGVTTSNLYMFITFVCIAFVVFVVAQSNQMGLGLLAGTSVFAILYLFGWVSNVYINPWILVVFAFLSVAVIFTEQRKEVVG